MILRSLQKNVLQKLDTGKAIIILGARQTGKTTLLKETFSRLEKVLWLNADEPDTHAIFENSSSSRLKSLFAGHKILLVDEAQGIWVNPWFWRTQDQQEIDYLEERNGKLFAWEFKWNPKARARLSKTFANAYKNHEFNIITPENYDTFLSPVNAG